MSKAEYSTAEHEKVQEGIESWIVAYIAKTLDVDASTISRQQSFKRLGLDSSVAVALTGDLGEWLGVEVDPASPYDYSTIEKLAAMLAAQPRVQRAFESEQSAAQPAAEAT